MNYLYKRNKYVNFRREERRNYKKDIVNKCKYYQKLFYRYVNSTLKNKEIISKLIINDEIYEDAEEMAEVMNSCFHSVPTRELLPVSEGNGN